MNIHAVLITHAWRNQIGPGVRGEDVWQISTAPGRLMHGNNAETKEFIEGCKGKIATLVIIGCRVMEDAELMPGEMGPLAREERITHMLAKGLDADVIAHDW